MVHGAAAASPMTKARPISALAVDKFTPLILTLALLTRKPRFRGRAGIPSSDRSKPYFGQVEPIGGLTETDGWREGLLARAQEQSTKLATEGEKAMRRRPRGVGRYLGRRPGSIRQSVVLAAAVAALALTSAALVYGDASHEGWPDTVVYKSHPDDQNGVLRGTGRSDELLGGHGNDSIYGRGAADVIWGDFKPCCQPKSQHDRLYGGGGNDYIYASHGTNNIWGGAGNDVVHAHYGRSGTIDCGTGNDKLFLSHRSKAHYGISNCERISFAHEGS
jgi:hypothetical protein